MCHILFLLIQGSQQLYPCHEPALRVNKTDEGRHYTQLLGSRSWIYRHLGYHRYSNLQCLPLKAYSESWLESVSSCVHMKHLLNCYYFLILCVRVFSLHVYLDATCKASTREARRGLWSPKAGVTHSCERPLEWVLRGEPWSSVGTVMELSFQSRAASVRTATD